MDIPDSILAQQAVARQNVALSVIKSSAKAEQAILGVLEDSARAIAASNRGNNVNFSA
jgi:hypothetical protein